MREEAQQLALIFETVGAFKVKRKIGKGKQIFGTWVRYITKFSSYFCSLHMKSDIFLFCQCYGSRSRWHNQGTATEVPSCHLSLTLWEPCGWNFELLKSFSLLWTYEPYVPWLLFAFWRLKWLWTLRAYTWCSIHFWSYFS